MNLFQMHCIYNKNFKYLQLLKEQYRKKKFSTCVSAHMLSLAPNLTLDRETEACMLSLVELSKRNNKRKHRAIVEGVVEKQSNNEVEETRQDSIATCSELLEKLNDKRCEQAEKLWENHLHGMLTADELKRQLYKLSSRDLYRQCFEELCQRNHHRPNPAPTVEEFMQRFLEILQNNRNLSHCGQKHACTLQHQPEN